MHVKRFYDSPSSYDAFFSLYTIYLEDRVNLKLKQMDM